MKRKFPLFVALLVLAQVSFAQFSIGVKAGANITKIDGRSFSDEFKYGYHLGGFATIGLGGRFAIQPEVLFNQLQTKTGTEFENIYQNALDGTKDVKLNYLSVPLLVNYKLLPFLSLQAGPQFGILLDQNKNLLQNGKDAFDKGDFSMLGGAQINFGKLRLNGRYVVGLNNINDIDNQDKWKNQGFQVSLGLGIL
ncbi:MAG: PorT family protein [Bacteroidota bacterium]|nr:PorT family protein [Bacteroidota bacterium]